jgi:DNA-binding NarL/FixJ family response regulator
MARIFIISSQLMFGRGLESLLRQEIGADIVGQETDVEQAVDRIKELQPDVVIVDSDGPAYDSTLALMHILRANPGIKVIGLSLQNNNLYTYRAKQWVARGVEDLEKAIDDEG